MIYHYAVLEAEKKIVHGSAFVALHDYRRVIKLQMISLLMFIQKLRLLRCIVCFSAYICHVATVPSQ